MTETAQGEETRELFPAEGGDADDRGRATRAPRRREGVASPDPGVFRACAEGRCKECCVGPVYVQEPWATAGLEPPSPFDAPGHYETCAHACHAPKTSGGSS